jgi:ribonucleoside-diphosphate reductase alpha chain
MIGKTGKILTGCGNLYVTINEDENRKAKEVFLKLGKAGGCAAAQTEAIGRLITLSLKSGVEPEEIIKQTKGISCHLPVGFGENKVTSCADAVSKALAWQIKLTSTNYKEKTKHRAMAKKAHVIANATQKEAV